MIGTVEDAQVLKQMPGDSHVEPGSQLVLWLYFIFFFWTLSPPCL